MRILVAAACLLSQVAFAQLNPCGDQAHCVLIGELDGGMVRLSGVLQTQKTVILQGDGGVGPPLQTFAADIKPSQPSSRIRILGNQSTDSTTEDVVIGGSSSRDGGNACVKFVAGGTVYASISCAGVFTGAGASQSSGTFGLLTVTSDAGIGGNASVAGYLTAGTLDAGSVLAGGCYLIGGVIYCPTGVFDTIDAGNILLNGRLQMGAIVVLDSSTNGTFNAVSAASITTGNGGVITTGTNGHVAMGADGILKVNSRVLFMAGTGDVTRSSGFGDTATVTSDSTAAFKITVGANPDGGGVVTLQSNTNGYSCHCEDLSDNSLVVKTVSTGSTSCGFKALDWAGAAKSFTSGDTLTCTAFGD